LEELSAIHFCHDFFSEERERQSTSPNPLGGVLPQYICGKRRKVTGSGKKSALALAVSRENREQMVDP
jgi:hypothetical protein